MSPAERRERARVWAQVARIEREILRLEVGWLAYLHRWYAGHPGQLTIADVGAVEPARVVE